jgi:hypothetical protein
MDRDYPVAEPDGCLILVEHPVLNPVSAVVEELLYLGANLTFIHSKVLVRCPKLSRPLPDIPEHPLMQFHQKILGQYLAEVGLSLHRPFDGLLDAKLFEFVELASGRDGGDQEPFLLIFVQRRLAVCIFEI